MYSRSLVRVLSPVLMFVVIGCSADERLVELSRQSADRQAAQSQQMAQQSQQVAEATHELVAADSKARQEMVTAQGALQQSLQQERSDLDRQHEALEQERQQIAATRNRDPVVAGAIMSAAVLLACSLPILLCWFVLRAVTHRDPDDDVAALLVQELVADEPLLLPANLNTPPPQPRLPSG